MPTALKRLRFICPICRTSNPLWRNYRRDRWGDYRHYDHCETCGDLGWDAAVVDADDNNDREAA